MAEGSAMCRLLGRASLEPLTDLDVIGAGSCADFQQLGRLHADGWGTAWLAEDRTSGKQGMARLRDPGDPVAAAALTESLTRVPSRLRVTHLRLATTGMANQVSNTHPFQWRDIVLAHNGSVSPVTELRALVTSEELEQIGGSTDSAMVFALIVRELERGVPLFEAVVDVVARLRRQFPRAALNLLVASPAEMIAVHANQGALNPTAELMAAGRGAELPRGHLDHYYQLSWRQDPGSVVFSSSGLDTDGWTPMAHNTAARVDLATLAVEFRPIGGPELARDPQAA
jgi:predicted glutamine amidotransferase